MTLNGHYALYCIICVFRDPAMQIWMYNKQSEDISTLS